MSPEQWLATQQARQPQTKAQPQVAPTAQAQPQQMSPEQWADAQEKPEMGFFEGLAEQITGRERATPETQALPEWTGMPDLNQMSMASLKSAIGTLVSNPKETTQIGARPSPISMAYPVLCSENPGGALTMALSLAL